MEYTNTNTQDILATAVGLDSPFLSSGSPGFDNQFSYSNALAKECGLENVTRFEEGAWMEQLYRAAATIRRGPNAGRYRDMEDAFEDRVNALVHEAMMGEQLPSVPPERRATARERSGSPQFSQTAARVA